MASVKLKGNPVPLMGEFPKVGSRAPDFVLVDGKLQNRMLKDFAGKRKLISIVPSLDTPVCSLSAKKFNEKLSTHPEVAVIVVSADLPFAQTRVCGAEKMEHLTTLSMMRSKEFAKDYGVLIQEGPLAGICARAILVLDGEDQVIYAELVPEITQEPDYERALEALLR